MSTKNAPKELLENGAKECVEYGHVIIGFEELVLNQLKDGYGVAKQNFTSFKKKCVPNVKVRVDWQTVHK